MNRQSLGVTAALVYDQAQRIQDEQISVPLPGAVSVLLTILIILGILLL